MREIFLLFDICFAFLFFLEGLDEALHHKTNVVYKISRIGYPLFMFLTIVYLYICELLGC